MILRGPRGSYKLTHWLLSPHYICHVFPFFLQPLLQDPHSHYLQGSQNSISDPCQVAVSMLLSLYSQPLTPPGSRSEGYTRSHCSLHPAFPTPPQANPFLLHLLWGSLIVPGPSQALGSRQPLSLLPFSDLGTHPNFSECMSASQAWPWLWGPDCIAGSWIPAATRIP